MKNQIKLTALFLLLSIGVFAGTPVKPANVSQEKDFINLHALPSSFGVGVSIQNAIKGNASVEITDQANHVLLTDRFSKEISVQKAYNLSELAVGDYTFSICSNSGVITQRVHIYEEAGEKTWFLFQ